ncbi:hypothetical protein [Brachybacterium hainanense]|uniref:Lipoprotein n=1 Tax=Brachybacterium hainanense TaxID=1541174 RepID=A0ABV6RDD3_9MICO
MTSATRTRRPRLALITVWGALAVLVACGGQELEPAADITLVTSQPRGPEDLHMDALWSGVVSENSGCVVVTGGGDVAILVAPDGSEVGRDEDGTLFLVVAGEAYPFDEKYGGGGFHLSDLPANPDALPGAKECVSATGATELTVIYDIEPA